MSTPDFEQMATSLYDAMGRGPETDIKCIAAALRLARAQALEEAAGVADAESKAIRYSDGGLTSYSMTLDLVAIKIRTLKATP